MFWDSPRVTRSPLLHGLEEVLCPFASFATLSYPREMTMLSGSGTASDTGIGQETLDQVDL